MASRISSRMVFGPMEAVVSVEAQLAIKTKAITTISPKLVDPSTCRKSMDWCIYVHDPTLRFPLDCSGLGAGFLAVVFLLVC